MIKLVSYGKIQVKLLSDIHKTTDTFNDVNHICFKTIENECRFCKEINNCFSSTKVNLRNEKDFNELKDNINDTFQKGINSAMKLSDIQMYYPLLGIYFLTVLRVEPSDGQTK